MEFVNCLFTGTRASSTQSRVCTSPRTTDGLDCSPVTGRPHAYTGRERAVTASYRDALSVPIGAHSYILGWPWIRKQKQGFPGGSVAKDLPLVQETGSIPGLRRSHMPRSSSGRVLQLLSLCSRVQGQNY